MYMLLNKGKEVYNQKIKPEFKRKCCCAWTDTVIKHPRTVEIEIELIKIMLDRNCIIEWEELHWWGSCSLIV